MRLLVSVRTPREAADALAGGADIIDAKEPSAGAIAAVPIDTMRAIASAVGSERMVSAAIGDGADAHGVAMMAREFASAGAAFVKVGFAGITDTQRIASILAAAVHAASAVAAQVVAVGYADHVRVRSAPPWAIAGAAAEAGAAGVLLDTAMKDGRGVLDLLDRDELLEWVAGVHRHGLFAALGGQITLADLACVAPLGVDIVGVRGAACDGGRAGTVSAAKVRVLADTLRAAAHHTSTTRGPVGTRVESSDRGDQDLPLPRP